MATESDTRTIVRQLRNHVEQFLKERLPKTTDNPDMGAALSHVDSIHTESASTSVSTAPISAEPLGVVNHKGMLLVTF